MDKLPDGHHFPACISPGRVCLSACNLALNVSLNTPAHFPLAAHQLQSGSKIWSQSPRVPCGSRYTWKGLIPPAYVLPGSAPPSLDEQQQFKAIDSQEPPFTITLKVDKCVQSAVGFKCNIEFPHSLIWRPFFVTVSVPWYTNHEMRVGCFTRYPIWGNRLLNCHCCSRITIRYERQILLSFWCREEQRLQVFHLNTLFPFLSDPSLEIWQKWDNVMTYNERFWQISNKQAFPDVGTVSCAAMLLAMQQWGCDRSFANFPSHWKQLALAAHVSNAYRMAWWFTLRPCMILCHYLHCTVCLWVSVE